MHGEPGTFPVYWAAPFARYPYAILRTADTLEQWTGFGSDERLELGLAQRQNR